MNSQKAFLFYDGDPLVKKDTLQHFDVIEGSFDGAEVCELVGLYLLNQLKNTITNEQMDPLMFIETMVLPLCTNILALKWTD